MITPLHDVLVSEVITGTRGQHKSSGSHFKQTTLEAHHNHKMKEFKENSENLTNLRAEQEKIEELIADLPESSQFSDEWRQLSDRVEDVRRRIRDIESDESRLNYFLDVGDMLFQYYDAQDSLAKGDIVSTPVVRLPSNSVLSYFSGKAETVETNTIIIEPVNDAKEMKKMEKVPVASPKKASMFNSTDGLNRDKMLEKYLSVIEPTAITSGIMPGSGIEPGWGCCPACDIEMTFYQNEALLGCPKCGYEDFILIDSEKPSYKDPPREITYFAYKKINHFNEWLAQFQAKENTDIPNDIVNAILSELKKERINDPKKVKKEKILEILRKLKLSKMYDHVQQIKNRIQQQMTMLVLSREMEEKLQFMFKEIQPAFIKYCPRGRSNFLSYPYVLYKLCQLLEMDEFLPCFQLLKSREKLYQQDQVWQKICKEMGWQFIKSI
jgi:predicted Zn-ribbon and HTH transcriptional regulator